MNITEPLRLATGSHQAGSGKGCAMNVLSWENGDSAITDLPSCSDPFLGRIVQRVNDSHCTHTEAGLLCPPCSIEVLDLAHRTVGSGAIDGLSDLDRRRAWVRIAAELAQEVVHLADSATPQAKRAIAAALDWVKNRTTAAGDAANAAADDVDGANAAADAANAAANAAAAAANAAAADAAADAYADAAYDAYAADAYAAAAYAATAAAAAKAAADAAWAGRLQRAHHIIDRFCELTGFQSQPTAPEVTVHAVEQMLATS